MTRIKTYSELQAALVELELLIRKAELTDQEERELQELGIMVDEYEKANYCTTLVKLGTAV